MAWGLQSHPGFTKEENMQTVGAYQPPAIQGGESLVRWRRKRPRPAYPFSRACDARVEVFLSDVDGG